MLTFFDTLQYWRCVIDREETNEDASLDFRKAHNSLIYEQKNQSIRRAACRMKWGWFKERKRKYMPNTAQKLILSEVNKRPLVQSPMRFCDENVVELFYL